jgi:hypothetical protein
MILAVPALVLLVAGLATMLCPAGMWAGIARRGSRMANQASMSGLFFFGGLGWLGGALLILYAVACWQGWRSGKWIEVSATVIESRLVETRQIRSTNPAWRVDVFYEYAAGGRMHRGSRLDFAGSSSVDRMSVERDLAARFSPGALLTVRVDPRDASNSVIEPGVPGKAAIFVFLGGVFVAIACWQLRALFLDWNFEGSDARQKRSRSKRRKRAG